MPYYKNVFLINQHMQNKYNNDENKYMNNHCRYVDKT